MSLKFWLTLALLALVAVVHAQDDDDDSTVRETLEEEGANEDEYAYDDDEYVHPLTDMPSESEEITVRYQFISGDITEKLPVGKRLSVLVGVINTSPEDYNVTFAMGSVNHPDDLAFYVQNLTQLHYNVTLRPNTEYTFQYDFKTNPQNIDVDSPYKLALTIFYENELEFFADTFFNETVNFYEPPTETDISTLATLVVVIISGIIGANAICGSKKKSSGPVEKGTADPVLTKADIGDKSKKERKKVKSGKNSTAAKKRKKEAKKKKEEARRRRAAADANSSEESKEE